MKLLSPTAALRFLTAGVILLSTITPVFAQRQMEKLGRGMIALRTSTTQVYIGWRLLGNDPSDVGFNLYRSANGGTAAKVNSATLTNTTDYVDTPANLTSTAYTYSLKPVQNGVEVADSWANPLSPLNTATLPANNAALCQTAEQTIVHDFGFDSLTTSEGSCGSTTTTGNS